MLQTSKGCLLVLHKFTKAWVGFLKGNINIFTFLQFALRLVSRKVYKRQKTKDCFIFIFFCSSPVPLPLLWINTYTLKLALFVITAIVFNDTANVLVLMTIRYFFLDRLTKERIQNPNVQQISSGIYEALRYPYSEVLPDVPFCLYGSNTFNSHICS